MSNEPAGAPQALAAFERVATEPDPIFALSEGFAIALRSYGQGVLSPETRRRITDELWRAEITARDQLPGGFTPDRLRKGVEALYVLICAWSEPLDAEIRRCADSQMDHLNVRIIANDLDTICATLELARGSATRPPVLQALQPRAGASTH